MSKEMTPREEIANWSDESCEETLDFLSARLADGETLTGDEMEFVRALEEKLGA